MSDKEFEKVTRKESDYKINQMFITNIDKLNCIKYNSFNINYPGKKLHLRDLKQAPFRTRAH